MIICNSIMPDCRKIAVLRANALGDFIFVLPALQALRETYPEAEIVYLGKPWHKTFLASRPSPIDRVVVIPQMKGVYDETPYATEGEVEDFFSAMQSEHFDLAVQLHGGGRYSNSFINRLGAKVTIGLHTPEAETLDRSIPYVYYQSEILRYLEVVSLVGAKTGDMTPKLSVTPKDEEEKRSVLSADSPYMVIHPGSTDIKRRWDPQHFAQVADYFARKGVKVIITGIPEEREIITAVVSRMKEAVTVVRGNVSLGGLAAILEDAVVVISNDTGPLHVATAVKAKTVGLFWCGNLITGTPMTRAQHIPLLSWITICPLCKKDIATGYPFEKDECHHEITFLSGITVASVIEAGERLIKNF